MSDSYEVLTGAGSAAIAVIRIRGAGVTEFAQRFLSMNASLDSAAAGTVFRAQLLAEDGAPLDDVLVTIHDGETSPEFRIHLHGGAFLVRRCGELLERAGFRRMATDVGELWRARDALEAALLEVLPRMLTRTGMAWLIDNDARMRIELARIAALPAAEADTARHALFDRPDVSEWFSRPLRTALIGPPNAGKSTLMNALVDREVSISHPTPGTTRDWVAARSATNGFPIEWIDTAGLRKSPGDALELAGIDLARSTAAESDAVLMVLDATDYAGSGEFLGSWSAPCPSLIALNKSDLNSDVRPILELLPVEWRAAVCTISALRRKGLDELSRRLTEAAGRRTDDLEYPTPIGRVRELLKQSHGDVKFDFARGDHGAKPNRSN